MKPNATDFPDANVPAILLELVQRLRRIEKLVRRQLSHGIPQEHYDVEAFGKAVGRRPFTIRQAFNRRRLHATKSANGRNWVLTHAELLRYRKEGLLPDPEE